MSVSIISYAYAIPITTKILNYKNVLQDLVIDDFKLKPPNRTFGSSPFIYILAGHVLTVYLSIINNKSL